MSYCRLQAPNLKDSERGATYIDYLKKQRDTILSVDIESRTKEQNKQLRMLNDQIAEETKNGVGSIQYRIGRTAE